MSKAAIIEELAREGRLYPSTVLYGSSKEQRIEQAFRLARILLCEGLERRGEACDCRHCRRIEWPRGETFHPDVLVLERDLRTATSADSTRRFLRNARVHPFEARGQIFVILEAESLTDEAASALLKVLEEPPRSAPRNFLLSCPAADALLPTIRSRSLSVYLGSGAEPSRDQVEELARELTRILGLYSQTSAGAYLLASAQVLFGGKDQWDDPRSGEPWSLASSALVEAYRQGGLPPGLAGPVLDLAADLLERGPQIRVRSVPAQRILEGLVAKHLSGV